MAKYKCLPNYEVIINSERIAKFDVDGEFETLDDLKIKILDEQTKKSPFIKRLDAVAKAVDEVADAPSEFEPEHVGGGYYLLSNGEKIKGKDAAIKAEAKLEK
ncbi:hypothetical protein [Robertmurraya sp. DFI.2.37]|uniref:hypothetical protein n=1 Tax=Robertmurraya sp. DFI.2.37 TaxID=3031819 RepID=UPI0023DB2AB4|nr:hypothetical protein [Robertmurraya sp. DFI.2.37]